MIKIFNELDSELIGIYLEHNCVIDECQPKYYLNQKLFDINEPFYMKSEKEALIRDKTELNRKTNKNNKRFKRMLNKKHNYDCLLTERQTLLINNIFNEIKDSIKQLSINSNSDSNKNAEQMARIALNFNEYQEYSDRLLCNPNNFSVQFNKFIIPANCSLICSDVIKGLKLMYKQFTDGKFTVNQDFMVVIDPPWLSNKSVKRKHCYQTDDNQNILEMTANLNCLLQLFPKQTDIKLCIWSTQKELDFVLSKMFPLLNCNCTHVLVWHKITRTGQSCKLRGSLEYLVIGSNNCSNQTECLSGVLVSIPSSIHSHKPPLKQLVDSLFNNKNCVKTVATDKSRAPAVATIVSTDSVPNSTSAGNCCLNNSIISCVSGIELYARYLNSGFHSIGYECLKLQNFDLYAIPSVS